MKPTDRQQKQATSSGESERRMQMTRGVTTLAKALRTGVLRGSPCGRAAAFAVPIAICLGGCSSTLNMVGDPYVAPQKFQFLRCQDIAKRLVTTQQREQELRTLMDRSSAGTGGSTINLFVYQPEYQSVTSELQQLKDAAAEKNCPPPPPAPPPAKGDTTKTDDAGKTANKK